MQPSLNHSQMSNHPLESHFTWKSSVFVCQSIEETLAALCQQRKPISLSITGPLIRGARTGLLKQHHPSTAASDAEALLTQFIA